jgi:hypothetical protein
MIAMKFLQSMYHLAKVFSRNIQTKYSIRKISLLVH